jgi:hypothetical protein
MKLQDEYYELTQEKQEEEAVKMTNMYYEKAEQWRKVAIKARKGKIKKPTKVNEAT